MGKREDPEKRRKRNRLWYLAHREEKLAYSKAYRIKNKEVLYAKRRIRDAQKKAADPVAWNFRMKMYRIAYEERKELRERMALDRDRDLGGPPGRR